MTVFFTADTHFGHANIIKYCNRPFVDVNEMDAEIISRWNRVVGKKDIVWHLGDFCYGGPNNAQKYFQQLNGAISLIAVPWHHDRSWLPSSIDFYRKIRGKGKYFSRTKDPVLLERSEVVLRFPEYGDGVYDKSVHLSHYPLASWEAKFHGGWHLYGHVHNNLFDPPGGYSRNVGVDVNNFYPISIDEIAKWESVTSDSSD